MAQLATSTIATAAGKIAARACIDMIFEAIGHPLCALPFR
jgi:hypothetical protein